jgi:tartrate dehydrogenase/decarboxylase/D-malate dehydrogenase
VPPTPPRQHAIALIPGDGIGLEVTPAACAVLDAAGGASASPWTTRSTRGAVTTSRDRGDDARRRPRPPAREGRDPARRGRPPDVPDHVSLWGLLIPIRRAFRQYVNLRPVRLLPGVTSPLRDVTPADLDLVVVRENNEGEYSEIGGRLYQGTPDELAVQQATFTRRGVERVIGFACDLAASRSGA